MIRYYIYSKPGSREKYTEVTEEQFISEVIDTEGRYYISFGDSILESSYEQFKEDKAEKDHARYISQLSTGEYPSFLSFDEGMDKMAETSDDEDGEAIHEKAVLASFWHYVSTLSELKRTVLTMFYYDGKSQVEIAKSVGKSQQNISYICKSSIDNFNKNRKIQK